MSSIKLFEDDPDGIVFDGLKSVQSGHIFNEILLRQTIEKYWTELSVIFESVIGDNAYEQIELIAHRMHQDMLRAEMNHGS